MRFTRTRFAQLLVDGLVVSVALVLAYAMRFEGSPPPFYLKQFILVYPYFLLLRLGLLIFTGVYRLVWRYVSLRDLPRIFGAVGIGTLVALAARYAVPASLHAVGLNPSPVFAALPLGVLAAEMVLSAVALVGVRATWRVITERHHRLATESEAPKQTRKRALLIGAGAAGVLAARELNTTQEAGFTVLGFLDDDARKHKTIIQGFKVLGSTDTLDYYAEALQADVAIITIARAPAKTIRKLVQRAENCGLRVQIIPGLSEILSGKVSIAKVRDVAIADLLGREPVQLDVEAIGSFLTGKRVVVTGAGGSIGSEICRQVAQFDPQRLVLIDQAENPIFHLNRELLRQFSHIEIAPVIASVTNRERLRQVLQLHRPDVVFHAAAHKHVPLMEANPDEAIINNVSGSRNVAEVAHELGVDAFVMISTDKAVNPTSVMGATKRMAEIFVQSLAARSRTRFITVRFGNVLGSQGSVVPLFKEQIAHGGPVTVTHPEMKRYFMTIPEASQLVLQAATMGQGGEIFILEMGEPIKISNLARDLIRLSGYRPGDDIAIEYVGMRPGEKLYEEINLSEENANKTKHPRIWVGKGTAQAYETTRQSVEQLVSLARQGVDEQTLLSELCARIQEYTPERLTDEHGIVVPTAPNEIVHKPVPATA